MQLSPEQQLAFEKYKRGQNVFISGPAGTGKSTLIKSIYEDAESRNINIHVTALTGCAAIILEKCKSKTLHSWAGIGLGNSDVEVTLSKIEKNYFKKKSWIQTRILIVDEISMLSKKLFDMLYYIGCNIRNNPRPFGGIQLIFLGDFYQLAPVGRGENEDSGKFCFESAMWYKTFNIENHIILKKIFRQTDEEFQYILNHVRTQTMNENSVNILKNLVGKPIPEGKIVTKIFPTKKIVEVINTKELDKLDCEEEYEFQMKKVNNLNHSNQSSVKWSNEQIDFEINYLKTNILCDENIILKVGCYVMCIINYSENIVNGSCGIVLGFDAILNYPRVRFNNGVEMLIPFHFWESELIPGVGISQIPLILSWSVTIHKIQGATLDEAEIDIGSSIFTSGQSYVALSRIKTLNGLYLRGFDENKIKSNPKVAEFYSQFY